MPDDKVLRCECGYGVTSADEADVIQEIRGHACAAHGIAFSVEDALLVVLRSELDQSWAPSKGSARERAPEGGSS